MKITMFLGGLSGGGTERVVSNLANYLDSNGHTVEIITMSDDDPAYNLSKNINRIALLNKRERKSFLYNSFVRIHRLKSYMRNSDTDEYLVMLPETIILLLALRNNTKKPIIVSERGDPSRLSKTKQLLLKRLSKRADGFVFQTEDAGKWYEPYIKGIRTEVIPNAINQEFLDDIRICVTREKKITGVGRFTQQKNFKLLISAFADVHKLYPDYELVIYGDGPQRKELEELSKELGIEKSVEMPGYVSSIGDKIYNSSVFVLSSEFEGIPNALMEAMALGVPCIATDCPVGGPRYLIHNMVNGILVEMNNREELAKAIICLINNPKLAEDVGKCAKHIREQLNPSLIYSRWEKFLYSEEK